MKRHLAGRRLLLRSTSGLGLALAGLAASPASAQHATPGSPQCPLTGTTVTCTGDIRDGFRANSHPTMNELVIRDLTVPIAPAQELPVVEVRSGLNLRVELAPGVVINATDPVSTYSFPVGNSSSRAEGAVALQLTHTNSTLTLRNAATINATFDFAAPGHHGLAGAILIAGARTVDVANTGAITVASPSYSGSSTAVRGSPTAIEILQAEQVVLINSAPISLSGSAGALIAATGRDIQVTSSGPMTLAGNDYELRPFDLIAESTTAAAARIALTNSAAIRSNATDFYGADERATSELELTGRGTITVTNTGAWTNAAMQVRAMSEARTDDITVSIQNDGALDGSGIFAIAGISCTVFCQVNNLLGDEVSVTLANRGTLNKAPLSIFAQGSRAQALLTNSGDLSAIGPIRNDPNFTRGGSLLTYLLSADGDSAMGGSAVVRLTNSGNLLMTDSRFVSLITADSSHALEVVNSGSLTARNVTGGNGIRVQQGAHIYNRGAAADNEEYVFDAGTAVTNSGGISLTGVGGDVFGIWAAENYGDVTVTNSGAIAVANIDADNFSAGGIVLEGFSDIRLTSSAPISATGSSGAAAGVFFADLSFSERVVSSQAGHLHGYDRAADLASRVSIEAQADITASGPGGYGVFGFLGVIDDRFDRRYATSNISPTTGAGSAAGTMTIANDRAAANIAVAAGATVTGGTGSGSAIGIQGTGTVTVVNAGTVLGRGNAGSGGIVLGDLVGTTAFGGAVPPRDSNRFLNLVDSVNTGTIRSDLGYGIWTQTGAITNLVNRGTIHGGQGSIAAALPSSVTNEANAVIDGRLFLTAAGSSLTNAGTLRATSPGAALHELNGNYTQAGNGTVALRQDVGDRMNVSGNFLLDGIFNLTLGAPSSSPIVSVGGNLTLDGTLNVTAGSGFGEGVYRIFNYGGTLTDRGLAFGTLPAGTNAALQTSIAGQVNLLVAGSLQFWDGPDTAPDGNVDGGSGTWNSSRTNWTRAAGDVNAAWSGSFAVFQAQPGTVTVDPAGITATGMQFAVNGYRIEGGPLTLLSPATVRVGDGTAAGSGYTATVASVVAGSGGIAKTDFGALVLTGANSYGGGTTVIGGVLQVSADNNLGAAAGALTLDGGTLRTSGGFTSARTFTAGPGGGTIDTQANALTLSGPVGGAGALTKSGTGTLTLSGASSAYSGRFTLGGGTLRLDGTLGGTLEVSAGTTMVGTGTARDLIVAGTLSPGTSIGTISATGNATFRAGSTFAVELAAAGGADRLSVAGTATIEGGTVAVTTLDPELNYVDGSTYTFLSAAGGRTGTFAALSESSAFLDFALGYTATTAFLTVDVIRTFPEVAQSFNQIQAATGLRALDRTAGSDSLAAYNAILLLDAAPALGAFDASSGEIYAVLMASALRRSEMAGSRLASRAYEAGAEGLGLWGGVDGHDGSVDGDGNGARFSFDGLGGNGGLDYRGRNWAVGIGGGWSDGDVALPGRASRAATDSWHVGAYASFGSGHDGFSASASAMWASGEADVTRAVAFGTIARTASSQVDVEATSFALDLRFGLPAGGAWAFGPALSVARSSVELGRFAETGAASLGLSGDGSSDDWTSVAAGAFASLRSGRGGIDASLQYLHGGGRSVEAGLSLAGAPAQPFRVRAAVGGDEAALLRVSGRYRIGGNWTIGGNLRAVRGSGEESIAGAVTLGLRF